MTHVGLSVISIFKCKRHYKSCDIGKDDGQRIMANYYSLCVNLCLLYFSAKHASDCWCNSQQIMHVSSLCVALHAQFMPNLCRTTQHKENMRNLYWSTVEFGY